MSDTNNMPEEPTLSPEQRQAKLAEAEARAAALLATPAAVEATEAAQKQDEVMKAAETVDHAEGTPSEGITEGAPNPHVEALLAAVQTHRGTIDNFAGNAVKSLSRLGLTPHASVVALAHPLASVLAAAGLPLDVGFTALETFYEHAVRQQATTPQVGSKVVHNITGAPGIVVGVGEDGYLVRWPNGRESVTSDVSLA